jgi:hypothetical protein
MFDLSCLRLLVVEAPSRLCFAFAFQAPGLSLLPQQDFADPLKSASLGSEVFIGHVLQLCRRER